MKLCTLALVLVALLLLGLPAVAQPTSGTLAGRVVDAQNLAVPGATVTVTGNQGSKTVTTDAEGRFLVPFLTPGTYTVMLDLQGFKPIERKNVEVHIAQRLDLQLTMEVSGVKETVVVTAAPPVVDITSTTVGSNLGSSTLARLPVGRQFSEALYLAPSVSSSGGGGRANPSIAGGSALDNTYVVDGVNLTNAGFGALGSYSKVFGSLGNGVPYDFMQEVQIKTGGYEAEYGQSMGGLVNVVTKSGSNQLRGSAFGYLQSDRLEGQWTQVATVEGTVNTTSTNKSDAGIEAGGPIIKNKMFFFGAVDQQWERTSLIAPDNFPLRTLGDVAQDRRAVAYAVKVTYNVTGAHRFDVSLFGDPAIGPNGPQRTVSMLNSNTDGFSKVNYGGDNQTLRYSGILSSHWLIEASIGRAKNSISEVPSVNEWQVTDQTVTPEVRTGGIGAYEAGNDGRSIQYAIKSTNVIGGHQIRYGVLYDSIQYTTLNEQTGPPFTLANGLTTESGGLVSILPDPVYGRIYRVSKTYVNISRMTTGNYSTLFVQDTWKVNNRLTINPGLRYEGQTMSGNVTKDFKLTNNWAPRMGFTYDPKGDGKTKVFGSFGLFYSKMPLDLAARALSSTEAVNRADYFDANLTQPIPDGVMAGGYTTHLVVAGLQGADQIDPNGVKATYVREFVAGFEHEVAPGMNLSLRYVHRSIPRIIEDIQPWPMVACDYGIQAACSVTYYLTNPNKNTPTLGYDLFGASFEDPVHRYDAVEVSVDKRFSNNWSLMASYRWSRLWGTYEGYYSAANGQSDPGTSSLDDFPTNDPSYTTIGAQQFGYSGDIRYLGAMGEGPLPLDRPHSIKLNGNYLFNKGLSLGAALVFTSGSPLTALAANPVYQDPGEIPEGPRGSGIQTVQGFQTRTPFETNVDAHVSYMVKLASAKRLMFVADVFNLFNTQRITNYDSYTQLAPGIPNPDFGKASVNNVSTYQAPREVRVGVQFQF
jgi:hypothetical protein